MNKLLNVMIFTLIAFLFYSIAVQAKKPSKYNFTKCERVKGNDLGYNPERCENDEVVCYIWKKHNGGGISCFPKTVKVKK